MIVARHEALETLQLGPDFCEKVSSDAIKAIAFCCPKLKKLRLSGLRDVSADVINALAKHCPNLIDIGFLDCLKVDEAALGNVVSVHFLSVAGTSNMKWGVVSHLWHKLPKLIGLDVSRTDIDPSAVSRLLSLSPSLKVLCAMNCPVLEEDNAFSVNKYKGKLLLALFNDIFKGLASLFADITKMGKNVLLEWRNLKTKDKNVDEIMSWLEWILSHTLLRTAESNPQGLDVFWLKLGAPILLSLMQSSQEEVQERAATGLATFVVIDDENASIDCGRAEAVMRDGGIRLLLNLAKSWREGLQSEAAKVNLFHGCASSTDYSQIIAQSKHFKNVFPQSSLLNGLILSINVWFLILLIFTLCCEIIDLMSQFALDFDMKIWIGVNILNC
jgi:hypothetical protein